jgi:hypothetical protein
MDLETKENSAFYHPIFEAIKPRLINMIIGAFCLAYCNRFQFLNQYAIFYQP